MAGMNGKTILVTGGTNGIGEATARALAGLGARVMVHGRSVQKGQSVVDAIKKSSGNNAVEFVQGDFASLASVRAMAEEVKRRVPKLDVLVNNAGRAAMARTLTADGFESMFGVNHLAPFLLTNLLLDTVKAAAPSRIVIVASDAHKGKQVNFDNLNFEKGGFGFWPGYHQSKLCNMLFALALNKRLQGTGVTVNALHPGAVRTGIGTDGAPAAAKIFAKLIGLFFISAEEGAKTTVHLATSPDVATTSGQYFDKSKPVKPHPSALDEAAAEKLWAISAKMVGL